MNANMQAIPTVVIGFGRMGRLHARTLVSLPGFDVAGVVETDTACLPMISAMGLQMVRGLEAMPRLASLAVIAVPSTKHASVFTEAARRGMDCLIEKPVGSDLHELASIAAFARASGVRVYAGYSERFNPSMASIRKAIKPGPCNITIRRLSGIALRREVESDVVHDLLAHDVDWLMHAIGAEPIDAKVRRVHFHAGKVEEITCDLNFPGGIHVQAVASRISIHAERTVSIVAADGRHSLFDLDAPRAIAAVDALTSQAEALAAALRDQPSVIADINDALRVQHVLYRLKNQLAQAATPSRALNAH
jgi:predicted dehydrogenase